ncbi:hypothetical protein ES708_23613 [subsurface metagenome]
MTGFAWFVSQALKPNPGLYLPLQGGTMSGDIDMAGHNIFNAEFPTVTKELFLPANESSIYEGLPSSWGVFGSVAGQSPDTAPWLNFALKVPDDFVSFVSLKGVWGANDATGDMYWGMFAEYGGAGEVRNIHTDYPPMGVTAIGGAQIINVQELATPLTLSNLARGDYLGIDWERDGTNPLDTLTTVVHFLGLLFTYEAER